MPQLFTDLIMMEAARETLELKPCEPGKVLTVCGRCLEEKIQV